MCPNSCLPCSAAISGSVAHSMTSSAIASSVARMDYLCHGSSPEFVRSLHPGMLSVVLNHMRQALPSASNYATQMLGTATFWNRCGEATTEEG